MLSSSAFSPAQSMRLLALVIPFFCGRLVAAEPSMTSPSPTPSPAVAEILTPPPGPAPRINGPSVFGVRPGAPFLYAIPATGDRPITFGAKSLPEGLTLDATTGQISGTLSQIGGYPMTLTATNASGSAERNFRIEVGEGIALTPPMGWNSWNCWGGEVSQEKVLSSARAMAAKGLRDHGWTYINIDDGWQGVRGGEHGAIQPNSKFPDMKALSAEVHKLGLKLGIYSTPWRGSYEGHIGGSGDYPDGSYDWITAGDHNEFYRFGKDPATQKKVKGANWHFGKVSFAAQDAAQWAEWGVDYLKYDWFPCDLPHTEEMARALRATGRDITYSLSNSGVYTNASGYARLTNAWRTTGDINDSWGSVSSIGFSQDRWAAYTGPGHWADPDMLVVGKVGWSSHLHPTKLTPDEQYTHVSLWCLLSAPLLIGCDLAQLDDFTLGLLTNDEVLAVNQDSLGKQATQYMSDGVKYVYAKPLEDGSIAVGLFNRGEVETTVTASWYPWALFPRGRNAKMIVRDLWRQKDIGVFEGRFETPVRPHGVVLVSVRPAE